jgi:hypothetical protein
MSRVSQPATAPARRLADTVVIGDRLHLQIVETTMPP